VVPPIAKLIDATEYAKKLYDEEEERLLQGTPKHAGYSFDPAMKVKGMRISAVGDADDVERKIKRIIEFLEKGHRVEVTLMGGSVSPRYRGESEHRMPRFIPKQELKRSPLHPVALLARRVLGETKDLAKMGPFAKSKKHGILRLWPCTPEQASRSRIPRDDELEAMFGGYSQNPYEVDDDFYQWKKREKARQIESYGIRRPGERNPPRNNKPDRDDYD